jgi:hypothetical protein
VKEYVNSPAFVAFYFVTLAIYFIAALSLGEWDWLARTIAVYTIFKLSWYFLAMRFG